MVHTRRAVVVEDLGRYPMIGRQAAATDPTKFVALQVVKLSASCSKMCLITIATYRSSFRMTQVLQTTLSVNY